ncbi:MAG: aldo/keto reductase [Lachnospiraceae bacterium]|nr:aldo/keto reductase [Lachnospiraceae bacterium]
MKKKANIIIKLVLLLFAAAFMMESFSVQASAASKKKILVVYYSRTGTTKTVAKKIQKLTGADIVQLKTKKSYPSDYNKMLKIAQKEQDKNSRPKLATKISGFKNYDTVIIGYPIWWGMQPMAINTFLESYNFTGKKVIPFCTSGGSSISASVKSMKKICKNASFGTGINATNASDSSLKKWLKNNKVSLKSAAAKVTLNINKKNVTQKTYSLKKGSRVTIKVSVSNLQGNKKIKYTSSNKKIATVTSKGVVKAKNTGTAKISVTVTSGNKKVTAWTKVKVVKKPENTKPDTEQNAKKTNILVAYFSCTGTTKLLAEYASQYLNADLYEIKPQVPYTDEDLNYNNSDCRANKEQNDSSARPVILGSVENMTQYDTIVLAYPIWWGQAPRIISTFLESYDFNGKTIVPFCTSHSSSIGSSDINLHSLTAGSVTWKSGRRFGAGTSKDTIVQWLDETGIKPFNEETKGEQTMERVFNFETKTVKLNSGYEMPINGIGTYSLLEDVCVNSVSEALKRGVRLIDTAYMYKNEEEVGRAVRDSGIPRSEIFVTTKLYPNQFSDAENAIDEALEKLDIGYIDLMLLHHPGSYDVQAYKAMEKAVKEGKIRSIGLSNWYIDELKEFLPQVTITPALVQNEIHPYYQESDVIDYIHSLGIVVEGWYPLGGRGHTAELLGDKVISDIASAHGKSSAQVILRWNLQKGVVVIPGSSNPAHIQENTELYDFELTEEEMEKINALNRDEKHDWY